MTERPLATEIHTKAMSRVRTALEASHDNLGIALYSLAHDNTIMDHYRDKLAAMDPTEIIMRLEAGEEVSKDLIITHFKVLRNHIRNAEKDRGNK